MAKRSARERWLQDILGQPGHEMLLRIPRSFVEEQRASLGWLGPKFAEHLDAMLGCGGAAPDRGGVEGQFGAFDAYGILHSRYLATAHGVAAMRAKLRAEASPGGSDDDEHKCGDGGATESVGGLGGDPKAMASPLPFTFAVPPPLQSPTSSTATAGVVAAAAPSSAAPAAAFAFAATVATPASPVAASSPTFVFGASASGGTAAKSTGSAAGCAATGTFDVAQLESAKLQRALADFGAVQLRCGKEQLRRLCHERDVVRQWLAIHTPEEKQGVLDVSVEPDAHMAAYGAVLGWHSEQAIDMGWVQEKEWLDFAPPLPQEGQHAQRAGLALPPGIHGACSALHSSLGRIAEQALCSLGSLVPASGVAADSGSNGFAAHMLGNKKEGGDGGAFLGACSLLEIFHYRAQAHAHSVDDPAMEERYAMLRERQQIFAARDPQHVSRSGRTKAAAKMHVDKGLLTLIFCQDDGLHVRNPRAYSDAVVDICADEPLQPHLLHMRAGLDPSFSLFLVPGHTMEQASAGAISAAMHSVYPNTLGRISVVLKLRADLDARIQSADGSSILVRDLIAKFNASHSSVNPVHAPNPPAKTLPPLRQPTETVLPKSSCHACGAVLRRTYRCSRCKLACYCQKACQRSDWPAHKKVCQKEQAPGRKDGDAATSAIEVRAGWSAGHASQLPDDNLSTRCMLELLSHLHSLWAAASGHVQELPAFEALLASLQHLPSHMAERLVGIICERELMCAGDKLFVELVLASLPLDGIEELDLSCAAGEAVGVLAPDILWSAILCSRGIANAKVHRLSVIPAGAPPSKPTARRLLRALGSSCQRLQHLQSLTLSNMSLTAMQLNGAFRISESPLTHLDVSNSGLWDDLGFLAHVPSLTDLNISKQFGGLAAFVLPHESRGDLMAVANCRELRALDVSGHLALASPDLLQCLAQMPFGVLSSLDVRGTRAARDCVRAVLQITDLDGDFDCSDCPFLSRGSGGSMYVFERLGDDEIDIEEIKQIDGEFTHEIDTGNNMPSHLSLRCVPNLPATLCSSHAATDLFAVACCPARLFCHLLAFGQGKPRAVIEVFAAVVSGSRWFIGEFRRPRDAGSQRNTDRGERSPGHFGAPQLYN